MLADAMNPRRLLILDHSHKIIANTTNGKNAIIPHTNWNIEWNAASKKAALVIAIALLEVIFLRYLLKQVARMSQLKELRLWKKKPKSNPYLKNQYRT